jgi:hypothetical protein
VDAGFRGDPLQLFETDQLMGVQVDLTSTHRDLTQLASSALMPIKRANERP